MSVQRSTWVVVGPKGLAYVGLHIDEASAWDTFLGWPSEDEIAYAKSTGYYAAKANITWHKPKEGGQGGCVIE